MKKTNWEAIRLEAIIGTPDPVTGTVSYPSLLELAAKHNVKYSTLSQRSSKEKWKKRREEALKKTTEKIQEKIESLQIGTLTQKYKQDLDIIDIARRKWTEDMEAGVLVVKTSELLSLLKHEQDIYRAIYGVKKVPDATLRIEIGKLDDSDRADYIRTAKRLRRSTTGTPALQPAIQ